MRWIALALAAFATALPAAAPAQDAPAQPAATPAAFVPERITIEPSIRPGPNVVVFNQGWDKPSQAVVLSADDLSRKGNFSVGLTSQLVLTKDRSTAYTASVYMKRITYGPTEAVVQEFDVATLTPKREIALPPKLAMVAPATSLLVLSADERYLFAANATPATSVAVIDLAAGAVLAEVPTPGCWSLYPALSGIKFTTLCGDGTLHTFTVAPDGTFSAPGRSEKIFDPGSEPLFIQAERAGDDLLFVSFTGNLYRVSDAGDVPVLKETVSLVEGAEGGWRPGGVNLFAYSTADDVLFVLMHPDGKEGSHKDAGAEVWAWSVGEKRLLSRSPAEGKVSLAVASGDTPVLYGLNDGDGVLTRYTLDPAAGYAATAAGTAEELGDFAPLVVAP